MDPERIEFTLFYISQHNLTKSTYKLNKETNTTKSIIIMPETTPETRQPSRIAANEAATKIAATENSDMYTTHKGGQAELTGSKPYEPEASK